MPRYRVSRKAQNDIRDIGQYTEKQWGRAQRRDYLNGMTAQFEALSEHPNVAPQRHEFEPPVRFARYQHHVIVYTEDAEGILIVRVLHERMDIVSRLLD